MPTSGQTAESYDAIPYDSLPLRPTHPSNLAVVAHFGGSSRRPAIVAVSSSSAARAAAT